MKEVEFTPPDIRKFLDRLYSPKSYISVEYHCSYNLYLNPRQSIINYWSLICSLHLGIRLYIPNEHRRNIRVIGEMT